MCKLHVVCECHADHPVVRCCCPSVSCPSYVPALSWVEPELHGVEVHVCLTAISRVKGVLGVPSFIANILL